MTYIYDEEFGEISIKTISSSRHIKLRVLPNGSLAATIPHSSAIRSLQTLLDESRDNLRSVVQDIKNTQVGAYTSGQRIGASHRIVFEQATILKPKAKIIGTVITVSHPAELSSDSEPVQSVARTYIKKALSSQASHYLPRRLSQLATDNGFSYKEVSFGNAKGRWGSCSSQGVIRLNIALMKLPLGLIDYVLIHELSHTKELNHSSKFWTLVEHAYPHYRSARSQIKQFTPYI